MKLLERVHTDWAYTLSTPQIWLERFMALICLPRLIWLLPTPQANFSTSVHAFTDIVPQWVWALWSVACAVMLWRASARVYNVRGRLQAVNWLGVHWLTLGTLYMIGEPRATGGWFYLTACLGPLIVIIYLSIPQSEAR